MDSLKGCTANAPWPISFFPCLLLLLLLCWTWWGLLGKCPTTELFPQSQRKRFKICSYKYWRWVGGAQWVEALLGMWEAPFLELKKPGFYANTKMFSVLYLCSRVWSQGLCCLQKFFYCTELFWLSWVFCFSIWNWVFFFWGLWRILLGFWWAFHCICRLLLVRLPFLLCKLYLPKSMGDFSFLCVSFSISFFLQRFKFLVT